MGLWQGYDHDAVQGYDHDAVQGYDHDAVQGERARRAS